jgi:ribonuclease Z
MLFELTILGCSGALPAYDRHPTSHFVTYNGQGFLLDCGEGTQIQMARYSIKRARLDRIFITHLHGDHFFGLIGLLTSFNLNDRERPLHIYGPQGVEEIVELHLKLSQSELRFPVSFHILTDDHPRIIYEDKHLTIETIILHHRIPTTGFLFREKIGPRKILADKLSQYQVPVAEIVNIKNGADHIMPDGTVIPNAKMTGDPTPPRSYAFCTDTVYTESFLEQIRDVTLLYHEATFSDEQQSRTRETMHSTTIEAATLALKANAGKLIIGHFSARYEDLLPLLAESRAVFPNTELAIEGTVFEM